MTYGERTASGENELEAWMDRYGPGLKRYFLRRVPAADAEELVQEVFLAMHARRSSAPIENVQGYLFSIASNLLARRKPTLVATALDEIGGFSESFSPERVLIAHQEVVLVVAAIRKLPPRAREAFILHRFEDMTYARIARRLNISVSAVSKLIARALAQITRELEAGR
jgi:RNA polymerase sigma factor (sigma-70 family)